MAERITYITPDEVTIVGDWLPAPTMIGAVLLLHMMPLKRDSWALFLRALNKRGLGGLAIDLRGHGESVERPNGTKLDFRNFSDNENQSTIWDIIGGVDWLRKRGIEREQIMLAGASIGANLCLRELAEEPTIPGAVLLSPGADYRGLKALEDVEKISGSQALFIASSEEDKDSFISSRRLFELAPSTNKIFLPYKGAGHGTSMFTSVPELMEKAADWLLNIVTSV